MKLNTVYMIRCAKLDRVSERLIIALSHATGRWPTLVCDERNGVIENGSCPKIPLTDSLLDSLGLQKRAANWGWFCGDFSYYAATATIEQADYFALFDSDVFMSDEAAKGLVKLLDRHDEQAIALQLGDRGTEQKFSRGLAQFGLPTSLGCIFPLTRVHRDVVVKMQVLRQKALDGDALPINDEAVLAGTVVQSGVSHARLEKIAPDRFASDTFETNPPHLYEALSLQSDHRLFHPVADLDTVLARIKSGEKNYHKHRLRRVLAEASKPARSAIREALDVAERGARS